MRIVDSELLRRARVAPGGSLAGWTRAVPALVRAVIVLIMVSRAGAADEPAPVGITSIISGTVTNQCFTMTTNGDKTVSCGSDWVFDAPTNIVDRCCTNYKLSFTTATNLSPLGRVATRVWSVNDSCGNTITCSQAVSLVPSAAVLSVYNSCGDANILVAFSDPVDSASALNLTNYEVFTGGLSTPLVALPVVQAALSPDSRIVTLSLSGSSGPAGSLLLMINGVRDGCANTLTGYQTTFGCEANPCASGNAGSEFWLTFPGNYAPDTNNPPQVLLGVSGPPGTIGSVSIPGLVPPFVASFTIPASGSVTVPLPSSADLGDANDLVQSNGVHLVASARVTVDAFDHAAYSTDGYLGLPTATLGSLYMALGYKNVFAGVPELNGSQFAVAAGQDNTTVTIIPSSTMGAHPAGEPFAVLLMKGQTYQLRNTNDAPGDVTGTIIASSEPVAVFGGHQCAAIASSNLFFCDYVVEQLLPATLWGTNFVTAPLATRLAGDTFRCLALQTNTTVYTNGTIAASLNQGGVAEFQLQNAAQIGSSQPVLVAQYANSSDADGVADSDPLMMLTPPTALYASSYQVTTPATNYFPSTANFLNITAPAAAVGGVILDGSPVSAGMFSAVGTSGYSAARVSVPAGPHSLSSSNGLPFGVQVYGWSLYDAYGYPGGICSPQAVVAPVFTCPTNSFSMVVTTNCLAAAPDLGQQIGNAAGAVLITQQPAAGSLLGPGTYPVSLTILDALGNRHVCQNILTVSSGGFPGLECPPDMVVTAKSPAGVAVNFAASLCDTNFTLLYEPPSGSIFAPGTNFVKVTAVGAAGSQSCGFSVIVNYLAINTGLVNGKLVLNWSGGAVLQQAASPLGPWTTMKNATSPYQPPITGRQGFFRAALMP